jgi:hypothetical protein
MRQILILVVTFFALAYCANSQVPGGTGQIARMSYELYSWQESSGSWSFSLLASPSGVNVSAAQVFDTKFRLSGVKELNRKISGLPVGATIFWADRIPLSSGEKASENKKLGYPPSEMIQDVRRSAEARKIKIEVLSDRRKQD